MLARILLAADGPLSTIDLKLRAEAELARLRAGGAHSHIPRESFDYAVEVGLRMLTLRRIVREVEGGIVVAVGERRLLEYYANSIAHLRSG